MYAGKPVDSPNQFYISGTDNYTKYLVDSLSERVFLSGRNLTMDRLYTSVDIAEYLYSKHQVMKSFIRRFFSTSLSTELPVVVLFTLYHDLTFLTLNTINV